MVSYTAADTKISAAETDREVAVIGIQEQRRIAQELAGQIDSMEKAAAVAEAAREEAAQEAQRELAATHGQAMAAAALARLKAEQAQAAANQPEAAGAHTALVVSMQKLQELQGDLDTALCGADAARKLASQRLAELKATQEALQDKDTRDFIYDFIGT